MIGRVVVGVDGSPASDAAVRFAAEAARQRDAELVVIHALQPPVVPGTYLEAYAEQERHDRERATELVEAQVAQVRRDHAALRVSGEVVVGGPAPVLLDHADASTLLVTGTRGHSALAAAVLGSVAANLVVHAPCPVAVVSEEAASVDGPVVVGVDASERDADALAFGFEAASLSGRTLTALHAWQDAVPGLYGAWVVPPESVDEVEADLERYVTESLAGFAERYPDVKVETRLVRANPRDALAHASREAAMVVVGSHGRSGLTGAIVGSVARTVLRKAHGVVVVARTA